MVDAVSPPPEADRKAHTDHLHCHLVISTNPVDSSRWHRLSKRAFTTAGDTISGTKRYLSLRTLKWSSPTVLPMN